ncbi:MAG: hypothetical protein AABW45_03860 [Nanoarchaeota archaeon]
MVLNSENTVKRRCMSCNEVKFISLDIKKPICDKCLVKRKNKLAYYQTLILSILLALILVLIVFL